MELSSKSFSEMKEMNKTTKDDDFGNKNHCNPEILNYLFYAKKILENYYKKKLKNNERSKNEEA